MIKALIAASLLAVLSACSTLGLTAPTAPQSFDQGLAQAYGVHTAVLLAATTAVQQGAITSAEASQLNTQAESARSLLDLAKSLETTNTGSAQADLTLATTALNALQDYIATQEKK